jgi:hypothetical protein
MFLLDILPYDPVERARRIKQVTINVVKDSLDSVRDTVDATKDTINATKDAVADSAAQSQLIIDNMGTGQSEASLLWPIVVVAVALATCLFLAYLYRCRLKNS